MIVFEPPQLFCELFYGVQNGVKTQRLVVPRGFWLKLESVSSSLIYQKGNEEYIAHKVMTSHILHQGPKIRAKGIKRITHPQAFVQCNKYVFTHKSKTMLMAPILL